MANGINPGLPEEVITCRKLGGCMYPKCMSAGADICLLNFPDDFYDSQTPDMVFDTFHDDQ